MSGVGEVILVVPAYNEADNLEPLTAAVFAAAPNGTGILVVDDASPDGTGELADELLAGEVPSIGAIQPLVQPGDELVILDATGTQILHLGEDVGDGITGRAALSTTKAAER